MSQMFQPPFLQRTWRKTSQTNAFSLLEVGLPTEMKEETSQTNAFSFSEVGLPTEMKEETNASGLPTKLEMACFAYLPQLNRIAWHSQPWKTSITILSQDNI